MHAHARASNKFLYRVPQLAETNCGKYCCCVFLSETVQKQELVLKINFSSAALIESGNHPFTDQTAIKAAPIAQISFRFPVLATAQN